MRSLVKHRHHLRNRFKERYDLEDLVKYEPGLANYIVDTKGGKSVDFSNSNAVRLLNRSLLKSAYGIKYWDLPEDSLSPPIPGRLDYVHAAADLLIGEETPIEDVTQDFTVLDIGTGASLIYPILFHYEYGWKSVATDINPASLNSAQTIIDQNDFNPSIKLSRQKTGDNFFESIVEENMRFDLVVCNPPFFKNQEEAQAATRRKNRNIHGKKVDETVRNFKGLDKELIYPGGEKKFLSGMIRESVRFKNQILWFSSLVSNKSLVSHVKSEMAMAKPDEWGVKDLSHGNKASRMVYWSFETGNRRSSFKS